MSDDDRDARDDRNRSKDHREGGGNGKRLTGEVIRWNERGFGFIKPDDGGEDVFCHVSSIKDGNMLGEGSKVEYELTYDERRGKSRAENVTGGIEGEDKGPPPKREGRFDGGGRGGRRDYDDRRDRDGRRDRDRGYDRRDRGDRNDRRGRDDRDRR